MRNYRNTGASFLAMNIKAYPAGISSKVQKQTKVDVKTSIAEILKYLKTLILLDPFETPGRPV